MSNVQSFISAFGNALKTVKNRAYESIDKLGYDLFYSDPRKTRVKLLKNKQVKTNQQKLIQSTLHIVNIICSSILFTIWRGSLYRETDFMNLK